MEPGRGSGSRERRNQNNGSRGAHGQKAGFHVFLPRQKWSSLNGGDAYRMLLSPRLILMAEGGMHVVDAQTWPPILDVKSRAADASDFNGIVSECGMAFPIISWEKSQSSVREEIVCFAKEIFTFQASCACDMMLELRVHSLRTRIETLNLVSRPNSITHIPGGHACPMQVPPACYAHSRVRQWF